MYYKLEDQNALKEYNKLVSDRITLRESSCAFAEQYDADPVILQDSSSIWLCGIRFRNNAKVNRNVWTKPCRQKGHSWLRVKPLKKEFKDEFDAEKEKYERLWNEYFPNGNKVSKEGFYKSIGLDWGSFFFNSFSCFEHNGVFYFDTTLKIKGATEILGSEYLQAKKDNEASKEVVA